MMVIRPTKRVLVCSTIEKDGIELKKAEIHYADTLEDAKELFQDKYIGYKLSDTRCSFIENGHINHSSNTEKL